MRKRLRALARRCYPSGATVLLSARQGFQGLRLTGARGRPTVVLVVGSERKALRHWVLLLALAPLLFAAGRVSAHEVRPAYLAITQSGPHSYDILWKQPT